MKKIAFVPIPRNASGSVRRSLEKRENFYTYDCLGNIKFDSDPTLHLSREQSSWKYTQQQLEEENIDWNTTKKFAVIRNPWSRVVSMYYHDTANFANQDFAGFLRSLPSIALGKVRLGADRRTVFMPLPSVKLKYPAGSTWHPDRARFQYHVLPQYCHFTDSKNRLVLDCLIKFENLDQGLNNFLLSHGPATVDLPKYNYSAMNKSRIGRSTQKHYSEYYTEPWMIELVEALYKTDVELGNYTFN